MVDHKIWSNSEQDIREGCHFFFNSAGVEVKKIFTLVTPLLHTLRQGWAPHNFPLLDPKNTTEKLTLNADDLETRRLRTRTNHLNPPYVKCLMGIPNIQLQQRLNTPPQKGWNFGVDSTTVESQITKKKKQNETLMNTNHSSHKNCKLDYLT